MDFVSYFTEQIGIQGIWFALFIYLFFKQDKNNKIQNENNKVREEKLERQLDKSNDQLDKSIEALKDLRDVKEAVQEINKKLEAK